VNDDLSSFSSAARPVITDLTEWWHNFDDPELRDQDFKFRRMPTNDTTLVPDRPVNMFDALMRCGPGDEPGETIGELQAFREAVADAIDALTPEQRFVIEAIHSERLSIAELAERLGIKSKGHAHRIVKTAEAALRTQLSLNPTVRERIGMTTPTLPEAEPATPTTWDEAARRIVVGMTPVEPLMPEHTALALIDKKIAVVRDLVTSGHVGNKPLGGPIVTIGVTAANLLAHQLMWEVDEIVALLCRKQHDYGHGNILSFGMVGVAVRLSDKVARFVNLTAKGASGQAEPLEDAILDMVGYAVIAQMLLDGTFTLNLDDELFPNAVVLDEAA
jgi:hypothetical protein